MLKFVVMCVVFIICSLSYFRLQQHINITSDVIGADKQANMKRIKQMIMWSMVASGALVLICGYDLLYTEGADKYLGKAGCGCGDSAKMVSTMPSHLSMSGARSLAQMHEF